MEIDDIICTFVDADVLIENAIMVTRVASIVSLLKGISNVSETSHKKRKFITERSDNYDRILIKDCLEDLAADFFAHRCDVLGIDFDENKWQDAGQSEYRRILFLSLPEGMIFAAPPANEVSRVFEEAVRGKLYFGISRPTKNLPIFELYLAFSDRSIIPIGAWSEGQKVLLSLILLVHYKKPSILLFDEVENHLHPEYISRVLEYLRRSVSQTVITTHHPHIIFSRFADVVNYIELERSQLDLADVIDLTATRSKAPKRRCLQLEKNYSKIISVYKLFDDYDNQLLRLSASNVENLTEILVETFTAFFVSEIVPQSTKRKPDLQSQKLYDILRKRMKKGGLRVLEVGAGYGRLLIDVEKIEKTTETGRIKWLLYEPNDAVREELRSSCEPAQKAGLVEVLEEFPQVQCDVVVIANVLHELTPKQIARVLAGSARCIEDGGCIVVIEIYPLLKPEKYAVPLSSDEWKELARRLGFAARSESIAFKNAEHNAFFVEMALVKDKQLGFGEMEVLIKEYWSEVVLKNRSGDYAGHLRLGDSDEIPKVLGNLATVASINASCCGDWT